jgi:hypothetical protein
MCHLQRSRLKQNSVGRAPGRGAGAGAGGGREAHPKTKRVTACQP